MSRSAGPTNLLPSSQAKELVLQVQTDSKPIWLTDYMDKISSIFGARPLNWSEFGIKILMVKIKKSERAWNETSFIYACPW